MLSKLLLLGVRTCEKEKEIAVCLKAPPTPEGGKGRGELKSENNIIKKKEQTNNGERESRERVVKNMTLIWYEEGVQEQNK